MNIVVFDDDKTFIDFINESLCKLNKECNGAFAVSTYCNMDGIIAYVDANKDNASLYILDILMNNARVGFTLAEYVKKMNEDNTIIFVTHSKEQILTDSAEHKMYAMLFIYKESNYFLSQLEYAIRKTYILYANTHLVAESYPKVFKLKYKDILYFKKEKKSSKVTVVHKESTVTISGNLKSLMNDLDGNFCYAAQDYIVNTKLVVEIDKKENNLTFYNGAQCPFSRKFKKELIRKCL